MSIPADDIEHRYSGEYERHLDPFKNFSLQEKQRKYAQLRTHDKATLGIVRGTIPCKTAMHILIASGTMDHEQFADACNLLLLSHVSPSARFYRKLNQRSS